MFLKGGTLKDPQEPLRTPRGSRWFPGGAPEDPRGPDLSRNMLFGSLVLLSVLTCGARVRSWGARACFWDAFGRSWDTLTYSEIHIRLLIARSYVHLRSPPR